MNGSGWCFIDDGSLCFDLPEKSIVVFSSWSSSSAYITWQCAKGIFLATCLSLLITLFFGAKEFEFQASLFGCPAIFAPKMLDAVCNLMLMNHNKAELSSDKESIIKVPNMQSVLILHRSSCSKKQSTVNY